MPADMAQGEGSTLAEGEGEMNEQWLLTREEWEEACGNLPEETTCGGCQKALARAQLR